MNTSFQYPAELLNPVERAETLTVSLQTSPVKFLPSQPEQASPQEKITLSAKNTESRKW